MAFTPLARAVIMVEVARKISTTTTILSCRSYKWISSGLRQTSIFRIFPGLAALPYVSRASEQNDYWWLHRLALPDDLPDRKSTRLNSSHVKISYAVFC